MTRSVLLAFLALATLGHSAPAQAGAPAPSTRLQPAGLRVECPHEFVDAAKRVQGLSGHGLRDRLDAIATSEEFWNGYRGVMVAMAESPQVLGHLDDYMRDGATQLLAIPGVPLHVLLRAMAATTAAAELLPRDVGEFAAAMEAAGDRFATVVTEIEERLNDPTKPVSLRRSERMALRGLVAIMVLGAGPQDGPPAQRAELMSLYAEGMEHLVRLVALGLEGDDAARADAVMADLRLPPLDREGLHARAARLQEATDLLDSTALHLDGARLRLPPDAAFRDSSDA